MPVGVFTATLGGESVEANHTVENLEALFRAAKSAGFPVFVSPHYYYPHDHRWQFEGALEALMHSIGMFDRKDALSLVGFEGSGADWLERYKPFIEDGATVVTSPHKVYGPETNDLVLQLRKQGIEFVQPEASDMQVWRQAVDQAVDEMARQGIYSQQLLEQVRADLPRKIAAAQG